MKRRLFVAIGLVIIAGGGLAGWAHWHKRPLAPQPASVVPLSIKAAVAYPVYYPDQAKLPAGYFFVASSFQSPMKNGVNYSINYGNSKKIVFTLQSKPSDSELKTFGANYIPLHYDFQTKIGQALIGAYHKQTLASLPVANGPWIVITAPPDINQNQFKQVLQSLRKD